MDGWSVGRWRNVFIILLFCIYSSPFFFTFSSHCPFRRRHHHQHHKPNQIEAVHKVVGGKWLVGGTATNKSTTRMSTLPRYLGISTTSAAAGAQADSWLHCIAHCMLPEHITSIFENQDGAKRGTRQSKPKVSVLVHVHLNKVVQV